MVIQAEPTTAQLPFEHPVLFSKERDDIALFPLKPVEQRRDNQVQRKHAPSLCQLPATFSDTTGLTAYLTTAALIGLMM